MESNICSCCEGRVRAPKIFCDICYHWIHKRCSNLSNNEFEAIGLSETPWYCSVCITKTFPFGDLGDDDLIVEIFSGDLDEVSGEFLGSVSSLNSAYHFCELEGYLPYHPLNFSSASIIVRALFVLVLRAWLV